MLDKAEPSRGLWRLMCAGIGVSPCSTRTQLLRMAVTPACSALACVCVCVCVCVCKYFVLHTEQARARMEEEEWGGS